MQYTQAAVVVLGYLRVPISWVPAGPAGGNVIRCDRIRLQDGCLDGAHPAVPAMIRSPR